MRSNGVSDRPPTAELLSWAVGNCLATDAALDALDEQQMFKMPVDDFRREEQARCMADREARDELIGHLLGLLDGPADSVAIVLPDGTVAAYTPEHDGLAVVPPDRVYHVGDVRGR